jgi:hypothetical protein
MKKINTKIFLFILALSLIISCGDLKLEEETAEKFSINLGEFKTFDEAEIFKSKMDFKLWNRLKIKQQDEKHFLLTYGSFNSVFEAGQKAFDLHNKSLIGNYKIVRNFNDVRDIFSNILFIAKYQGRPSVFNYNLITKKSKVMWSRWGRKVLTVCSSGDRNSTFIITASSYGKQAGFPFLKDVKLYFFDGIKNKINEISEFGDGMQVYSYWENKDTFKINLTQTDPLKSEKIIQTISAFDKNGNKGEVKKRNFILTKDGFPKPPDEKYQPVSPKGTFQFRAVYEENENSIYLRDLKKNAEVLISGFSGKIKNIWWTPDEKYLFMIISKKGDGKSGNYKLLAIDTNGKKITRSFDGSVYMDLFVQGNLLFFDRKFEGVSQITIYDFVSDNIYGEIKMPGGCGINDLYN